MVFEIASTTEQKVIVKANPVTAEGNPARIDGALSVDISSGDATFTQDPAEPLEFEAISSNTAGQTIYKIQADVDTGTGVSPISESIVYTVSDAMAETFGFTATVKAKDETDAPVVEPK